MDPSSFALANAIDNKDTTPAMEPIYKLPRELVSMLCAHVDTQGLKNLRLTNKDLFKDDATRLLFEHLVLFPNLESIERLENVAQHPQFAAFARKFTYSGKMVRSISSHLAYPTQ